MGTWRLGGHSVIGGVRYEHVNWKNTNYQVSYLDEEAELRSRSSRATPMAIGFPASISVTNSRPISSCAKATTAATAVRASANLTAGRFVNEDGDIVDGNPNLKPALSDNFDAQLEYYTDNGGLYSVAVFYKNVKNFSYTQVYNFSRRRCGRHPDLRSRRRL